GAVYEARPNTFTQLTTPAGRPLPLAEQRRRTGPYEPLSGGLRLLTTQLSAHEVHVALVDRAGTVPRAWRISSKTNLGLMRATAVLAGSDVIVPLDVYRTVNGKPFWEHLVLRLTP